MNTKNRYAVCFVLLGECAEWEVSLLASALRNGIGQTPETPRWQVRWLTPNGAPVRSLSGMQLAADGDLTALPDNCAALILAGGTGWQSPQALPCVSLVAEARRCGIPVGGICAATLFLAAHGFLNDVYHTGNTPELMKQWGSDRYTGATRYVERQAVSDGGIITANGTAILEFARKWLFQLEAGTPEQIDTFVNWHKNGFYPA